MTSPRRGFLVWWGAGIDVLAGLVVLVLMVALFLWGSPSGISGRQPTATEVAGYWITASVVTALLVVGFGVAVSQRRWAAIVVYPIVTAFVVGTILVFAFPTVDWSPDVEYPANPYACTLTDSENCPGG